MSLERINDFPDRLSPMLVKELRQGLRAKTFVSVFLTLQIAMALILFSAGASASSSNAGSVISGVIFVFFSIAVLIVQPLRGIGAVSSEVKGNTIDMMVLTRLSASRIVYGKWFALVGQSALLLVTIIPYLILRYFFGGMELVGEIMLLVMLFITSVSLTAITVGLSANSSFLLRGLLPLAALPVLVYVGLFGMFSRSSNGLIEILSLENNDSRLGVALYLAMITYLGWSMLSLGASLIAPSAENHSTLRRSIVLIIAIISCLCFGLFEAEPWVLPWLFTIIAMPAIGIALSERSLLFHHGDESLGPRGIFGKITGSFLSPGWASGVVFTFLLTLTFLAARLIPMWVNPLRNFSSEADVVSLGLVGTALFPGLLAIIFVGDESARFSSYVLMMIGSAIFAMVMFTMSQALSKADILWFFIWDPFLFLPMAADHRGSRGEILSAAGAVSVAYGIALLAMVLVALKRSERPDHDEPS